MTIKEAVSYAKRRNKALGAYDFHNTVIWVTLDSCHTVRDALVERKADYWFLFTEHHGFEVQHDDEVVYVAELPGRGTKVWKGV